MAFPFLSNFSIFPGHLWLAYCLHRQSNPGRPKCCSLTIVLQCIRHVFQHILQIWNDSNIAEPECFIPAMKVKYCALDELELQSLEYKSTPFIFPSDVRVCRNLKSIQMIALETSTAFALQNYKSIAGWNRSNPFTPFHSSSDFSSSPISQYRDTFLDFSLVKAPTSFDFGPQCVYPLALHAFLLICPIPSRSLRFWTIYRPWVGTVP